jgi:hypothetical protein
MNTSANFQMEQKIKKSALLSCIATARLNLLVIAVLTAINIALLVTGGNFYFLFSAALPTFAVDVALMLGGGSDVMTVALLIAALVVAYFVVAWFFSANGGLGWMVATLTVLACDTIALIVLYEIDATLMMDLFFHVYMVVMQVIALVATCRIKRIQAEELSSNGGASFAEAQSSSSEAGSAVDSPILRVADTTVRARVFLEVTVFEHKVTYRRVKRTNELVIDGNVYAEYSAWREGAHMLNAQVGGHAFSAGLRTLYMNGVAYIIVDGQIVAEKARIF